MYVNLNSLFLHQNKYMILKSRCEI